MRAIFRGLFGITVAALAVAFQADASSSWQVMLLGASVAVCARIGWKD